MRTQILLLAFLFTSIMASCQGTSAGVTIPPQQTFLLGEYADYAYTAKLKNKGPKAVSIELRSKGNQDVITAIQLSPKQSETLTVGADQVVAMINNTKSEAEVSAKMSDKVIGMRYVGNDGADVSASEQVELSEQTSSERYAIDAEASEATSSLKSTISSGQALVLGEGTSDNYTMDISKLGGGLKVSIRNRNTLEQTQGFGLGNAGVEKVNIRPYEVIYLESTGSIPVVVSVNFSQPVSGERVVAGE